MSLCQIDVLRSTASSLQCVVLESFSSLIPLCSPSQQKFNRCWDELGKWLSSVNGIEKGRTSISCCLNVGKNMILWTSTQREADPAAKRPDDTDGTAAMKILWWVHVVRVSAPFVPLTVAQIEVLRRRRKLETVDSDFRMILLRQTGSVSITGSSGGVDAEAV